MEVGFSSLTCPDWDVETLLRRAPEMGASALEFTCGQAGAQSPAAQAFAGDPEGVAARIRKAGVDLACLSTDCSFAMKDERRLAEQKTRLRGVLELAGRAGCRHVAIGSGEIEGGALRNAVLIRIANILRELAPVAAAQGTTIVLENNGSFPGSRDAWFILDAVNHPALKCCWNPHRAWAVGESASLSVPRLSGRLAVTHLWDVAPPAGNGTDHPPGGHEDGTDIEGYLNLLRGIGYAGPVILTAPGERRAGASDSGDALSGALARIREILTGFDAVQPLSAYKGDKNAPTFAKEGARG